MFNARLAKANAICDSTICDSTSNDICDSTICDSTSSVDVTSPDKANASAEADTKSSKTELLDRITEYASSNKAHLSTLSQFINKIAYIVHKFKIQTGLAKSRCKANLTGEALARYLESNRSRHKKFCSNNKEKIRDYQRIRRARLLAHRLLSSANTSPVEDNTRNREENGTES